MFQTEASAIVGVLGGLGGLASDKGLASLGKGVLGPLDLVHLDGGDGGGEIGGLAGVGGPVTLAGGDVLGKRREEGKREDENGEELHCGGVGGRSHGARP